MNREMAYQRGYERCIQAKGRHCINPYPHGTDQAEMWMWGWKDALEIVQVQRKERKFLLALFWLALLSLLVAVGHFVYWLAWLFMHS